MFGFWIFCFHGYEMRRKEVTEPVLICVTWEHNVKYLG